MSGRPTSSTTSRGRCSLTASHAVFAGRRLDDPEPLAAQIQLDQVGDIGLIVDDENGAALHMSSIVSSARRINVSFV